MHHLVLEKFVNDVLQVNNFQDYCPNGLQVQGKPEIKKIATAVTASRAIIEQAIDAKVDALLVHHGYFWKGEDPCIRGVKKERLALLIQHKINLYAYHLPLDAWLEYGNNASIASAFQLQNVSQQANGLLWKGFLSETLSSKALLASATKKYGPQVRYIGPEKESIQTVAFCSGGGQDFFEKAIQSGADVYLTGEYAERVFHLAHESGVGFIVLGHHASEKDGIKNLGQYLEQTCKLEHLFLDENNPL